MGPTKRRLGERNELIMTFFLRNPEETTVFHSSAAERKFKKLKVSLPACKFERNSKRRGGGRPGAFLLPSLPDLGASETKRNRIGGVI